MYIIYYIYYICMCIIYMCIIHILHIYIYIYIYILLACFLTWILFEITLLQTVLKLPLLEKFWPLNVKERAEDLLPRYIYL